MKLYDMVGGESGKLVASGSLKDVKLWSDTTPNLYDVYSVLSVDGKVMDVAKTHRFSKS